MSEPLGSYRTVKRVLDALEQFASTDDGLRISDVSRELGIPLSSTQVMLRELEKYDYVRSTPGKRYIPGSALISLAVRINGKIGISEFARPHMRTLADKLGEDVYFALPGHDSIMYVDCVTANAVRYRLDIPLGLPRPLHASAAGHILLAHQSPEYYKALVDRIELTRFTGQTITDRAALDARVALVRERGYAISYGEAIEGIVGIGAPVHDRYGALAGVLTLSLLAGRVREPGAEHELIGSLVETAWLASKDLGWDGPRPVPAF